MMSVFAVPSTRKWINPDGSPTQDFFLFIRQLFETAAGSGVSTNTIQSNISGAMSPPLPNTLSQILDAVVGNVRGEIIVRGASAWQVLSLGPVNQAPVSNGSDLVYATIVNSINGVNGVSFSSATGAVSCSLSNAVVLAPGAPASLSTAGGDLLLQSATKNVKVGTLSGTVTLGADSGITKYGQTSKAAAVAGNFSATRFITVQDGAGTLYYIPAATTPW